MSSNDKLLSTFFTNCFQLLQIVIEWFQYFFPANLWVLDIFGIKYCTEKNPVQSRLEFGVGIYHQK